MSFDYLESSRYSGTPVELYLIVSGANTYAYCNGETTITRAGVTYTPHPIKSSEPTQDGTLDKNDITINMARGTPIDDLFLAYPPSNVVNLTIFAGHVSDTVTAANFPALWMGRVVSGAYEGSEMVLSCMAFSSSLQNPGLRRFYQVGCPHALFGTQCGASKAAATVVRTVTSFVRNQVTVSVAVPDQARYIGGLMEWGSEIRTVTAVSADGKTFTLRGTTRNLAVGGSVNIVRGCDHQMTGCNQHANIQNYGGQPFIPLENPLSQKNQFY